MRIILLSDTHSHMDSGILEACKEADEIWHAGDIGQDSVIQKLETIAPVRAVYGNIDDASIRHTFPLNNIFDCEGLKVFMTHIGGYPGRYNARVKNILKEEKPGLYICGHSHILKVIPDQSFSLLHMNPGACGHHGFHKVRTLLRFNVEDALVKNLEVVELGRRGTLK